MLSLPTRGATPLGVHPRRGSVGGRACNRGRPIMLKCRLVLALALAAWLASHQESSLASQPKAGAKPAAAHPPNNLVCQVAAVNAATFPGSIEVHPGYTIVRPQITYRYVIT